MTHKRLFNKGQLVVTTKKILGCSDIPKNTICKVKDVGVTPGGHLKVHVYNEKTVWTFIKLSDLRALTNKEIKNGALEKFEHPHRYGYASVD